MVLTPAPARTISPSRDPASQSGPGDPRGSHHQHGGISDGVGKGIALQLGSGVDLAVLTQLAQVEIGQFVGNQDAHRRMILRSKRDRPVLTSLARWGSQVKAVRGTVSR